MNRIEFLVMIGLLMLKVLGVFGGAIFFSFLGTLIYDEIQALRSKTPYELWLAAMVGAEFLIHGKPAKPAAPADPQAPKYHGRHRAEDPFISDLVIEMRANPNSLCYNQTMYFEEGYVEPTKAELCGVF